MPEGASLVSGNLTWQGDLKVGKTVSLFAEIVFRKVGHWAIEENAYRVVDEKNSWGDLDVIYLTVGIDQGKFGWPLGNPAPIQQTRPGDSPGVPSTQEEPPVESLPPAPAVSQNGTIIPRINK